MNWARLLAIVVGAGVLSSLTDWFFAGDWIHRRYAYPEIWRQSAEEGVIAVPNSRPQFHSSSGHATVRRFC